MNEDLDTYVIFIYMVQFIDLSNCTFQNKMYFRI